MVLPPLRILLLALPWATDTAVTATHPNDGPDADVRIQIKDDRVSLYVAVNLAFVDAVLDHPREDPNLLAEVEAEVLREDLFAFLARETTVEIDGLAVTPVERGFRVTDAPPDLVPLFPRFGARALIKVQFDLEFSAKSPPEAVRLRWGAYPPDAVFATPQGTPPIEVVAQLTAEGSDSLVTFTQEAPEHLWTSSGIRLEDRFLAVPDWGEEGAGRRLPLASGLALACALGLLVAGLRPAAGAALRRMAPPAVVVLLGGAVLLRDVWAVPLPGVGGPSEDQARAIFQPLHANIYRAFDYTEESDVYDALARSVEGELLDGLYTEIYGSLVLAEAGGAVSRVQSVDLLETEVRLLDHATDGRRRFEVEALWQVEGSVFHWGHAHSRTNEYRARYSVRAGAEGWRIAASQVLSERRVDAAPLGPLPPDAWGAEPLPDPAAPRIEDL